MKIQLLFCISHPHQIQYIIHITDTLYTVVQSDSLCTLDTHSPGKGMHCMAWSQQVSLVSAPVSLRNFIFQSLKSANLKIHNQLPPSIYTLLPVPLHISFLLFCFVTGLYLTSLTVPAGQFLMNSVIVSIYITAPFIIQLPQSCYTRKFVVFLYGKILE